jgi:hypothetical protein
VPLTKEGGLQLEISGKVFGIIQSSRYQAAAMFLGPARFVNHGCKANSEILRADQSSARIVALKDIKVGVKSHFSMGKITLGTTTMSAYVGLVARALQIFRPTVPDFPDAYPTSLVPTMHCLDSCKYDQHPLLLKAAYE